MTSVDRSLPAALQRALPLLADPPPAFDTDRGYLDLLGSRPPESPGPIQSLWASGIGATFYDHVQSVSRRVLTPSHLPDSATDLPPGARVLDIGCGPGNITATLGNAVGPSGLALGLDVSEPMLERAVQAEAGGNTGFLRADARALPFHESTFDAVVSLLALQLVPEPFTVLEQMTRVLVAGGKLTILVPTAAGSLFHRLSTLLGNKAGVEFFEPEEVADTLHANGMESVHTRQRGSFLWIAARKAA
jgi:arsenite methyltransferase